MYFSGWTLHTSTAGMAGLWTHFFQREQPRKNGGSRGTTKHITSNSIGDCAWPLVTWHDAASSLSQSVSTESDALHTTPRLLLCVCAGTAKLAASAVPYFNFNIDYFATIKFWQNKSFVKYFPNFFLFFIFLSPHSTPLMMYTTKMVRVEFNYHILTANYTMMSGRLVNILPADAFVWWLHNYYRN
jgi:hypothetical protein